MFSDADILSVEVNRARFNTTMARYIRELGLAPESVVRSQVKLAMKELADKASPQNLRAAEASINKDISTVYRPIPNKPPRGDWSYVPHRGYVYLAAGPNFLLSVKDQNYHPNDSVEDMKRLFHKTKEAGINRGNAFEDVGTRSAGKKGKTQGRQHIINGNRIFVKRAVYLKFRTWLKTRLGILGASWCAAWDTLGSTSRPPNKFKWRHVQNQDHKGAFINGLGIPGKASFTIINRATGVESVKSLRMVSVVLRHRTEAMKVDIRNILRGAYKRSGWSK